MELFLLFLHDEKVVKQEVQIKLLITVIYNTYI